MIRISVAHLWVHDQDEALDFYTNTLGMEVREDVTVAEMGNFRWLTVGPPAQPDVASSSWRPTGRCSTPRRARSSRS